MKPLFSTGQVSLLYSLEKDPHVYLAHLNMIKA